MFHTEQAVVCIRSVNKNFEVREDFVGLYDVNCTTSESIFNKLQEVLVKLNLSTSKLRGQCYDGASNMAGKLNGVAKRMQNIENRGIYIQCQGHIVNLAASDCIKGSKALKQALDYGFEIIKLIKKSPKREAKFKTLKEEIEDNSSGISKFAPTRYCIGINCFYYYLDLF